MANNQQKFDELKADPKDLYDTVSLEGSNKTQAENSNSSSTTNLPSTSHVSTSFKNVKYRSNVSKEDETNESSSSDDEISNRGNAALQKLSKYKTEMNVLDNKINNLDSASQKSSDQKIHVKGVKIANSHETVNRVVNSIYFGIFIAFVGIFIYKNVLKHD